MGMLSGEMTPELAIDRMVDLVGFSRENATHEVSRYTMMPTHPFGFITGCTELEKLQASARAAQGDAFSWSGFHDQVLSYGHMPPPLIARAVGGATG
jgi:uncharacterized protein (DUF885 family)